jgi:hypothetical protein
VAWRSARRTPIRWVGAAVRRPDADPGDPPSRAPRGVRSCLTRRGVQ